MSAMTYDKIRLRIARKRGYLHEGMTTQTLDDLDQETKDFIEELIEDGQDKFYYPGHYDWTWLKPIVPLTIADGQSEIVLPANFGRLEGEIYFDGSHNETKPVKIGNKQQVLAKRQHDNTQTGRPLFGAIEERAPGDNHGSRKYLMFYPEADDDYTIWLQYSILTEMLSTRQQFPYGGAAHGQTILQACLAASEQFDNELGVHTQLFKEHLAASIEYDRRAQPQTLSVKEMARTRSRAIATYDNTGV